MLQNIRVDRLVDVNTNSTVPHVTYFVTISNEGKVLMKEWFHDHEGDLYIRFKEVEYTEGEPSDDGLVIFHYSDNKIAAVEIMNITAF